MNHRYACAALAVLLLTASAGAAAEKQADRKYTETSLGSFPREVYDSAVVGPDGRRIACIQPAGKQQAVVLDGKMEKTYDRVGGLSFSPNSQWFAYAASSGGKWFIVLNGRELDPHDRVGPPVFAPQGKRFAYTALQADGEHVAVVDVTKPGPLYERIFEGKLVFSRDGQHLAYGARKEGKWLVVIDGQENGPYDFLGSATGIHFSPSGQHTAYAVRSDKEKKWCVVVDGKPQKWYDNVGEFAFSPDGMKFAYTAQSDGKWRVVLGTKEHPPYDAIGEGTLQFSPNSATLAYAAQTKKQWVVVAGGDEGRKFDGIGELRFSPNGRLLAHVARIGNTELVVLNRREQRLFDRIGGGTLVFSADSERLGYVARSGRDPHAVIDGKIAGDKRKSPYDMLGYLTFAPDGRRFVCAATAGKAAFTIYNGIEANHRYEAIWSVPDARFVFDGPKKFHYLGIKAGNIYLVEEEIE
jgi:WD40 repeat protein